MLKVEPLLAVNLSAVADVEDSEDIALFSLSGPFRLSGLFRNRTSEVGGQTSGIRGRRSEIDDPADF